MRIRRRYVSGRRTRRHIVRGLALLGTVLVLVLFGGVGGASAHAALKGSDPQDGSVVKKAPTQITLTFTESVGLLDDSFRVITPENRRVDTGKPGHAGDRANTALVSLPDDMGTGTFTVAWRVVSADSHPVSGAFTFSIGKPSATAAVLPAASAQDTVASNLYDITRYVAYGGLAVLIGAAVFVLACGFQGSVRRLLLGGWWTLFVSTLLLLLLRGPYERGSGLAAALDPAVLRETLTSRPGLALVARLVLLGAVVFYPVEAGERGPGRVRWAIGGALALGLAVTWAAAEHASAGIQVPVAMVSSVLHLLAMAVWLGGLTTLLTALYRTQEPVPAAVVSRFSRLALGSVAVLAATGVYQSWRGLGTWDALTSTSYGRILLVKLCAVLLLLAGAWFSRRWTGRLALPEPVAASVAVKERERERVPEVVGGPGGSEGVRDDVSTGEVGESGSGEVEAGGSGAVAAGSGSGGYRRALRRSVFAEVGVGIVVLVVTTVLTGTQPGRAATETAAAVSAAEQPTGSTTLIPFDVGTPGGHGKVQIELAPGRVGENSVQAVVYGPDGGLATVPELRLTFTLPKQDVGPIDAQLADKGGYWATDGLTLPLAGTWTMKATVRTSDIDQVTVSKTVKIG
ncbi:copper resistance CopC/CopD family protein [Streptomyces sp. NPDC057757]|uniref:copper resistance CopC/CopD family protein n=1 Tax=Streptomyces sp. NPDC057757 TaxID=3346241 RepID=UPI0036A8B01A